MKEDIFVVSIELREEIVTFLALHLLVIGGILIPLLLAILRRSGWYFNSAIISNIKREKK